MREILPEFDDCPVIQFEAETFDGKIFWVRHPPSERNHAGNFGQRHQRPNCALLGKQKNLKKVVFLLVF